MEFSEDELLDIERACGAQSQRDRQSAEQTDRPMIRNQRNDSADRLNRILARIQENRRLRAPERSRESNGDH